MNHQDAPEAADPHGGRAKCPFAGSGQSWQQPAESIIVLPCYACGTMPPQAEVLWPLLPLLPQMRRRGGQCEGFCLAGQPVVVVYVEVVHPQQQVVLDPLDQGVRLILHHRLHDHPARACVTSAQPKRTPCGEPSVRGTIDFAPQDAPADLPPVSIIKSNSLATM